MCAHAADVYDSATGRVLLESVVVGATRYQAVVVVPGSVVSFNTGTPQAAETYFDLGTGQLTMRTLTVGPTTYSDVVITIASLVSVGTSASVDTGGTAPANTLVALDRSNYPLRVTLNVTPANLVTSITYDFHKIDGSMTPCTYSISNEATCHGVSNTITNITQSGTPVGNNPPNNATLNAGPDTYGYSFAGKVTGKTWVGTWTAVRTTPSGLTTQSGPFSVDCVVVQGNGQ